MPKPEIPQQIIEHMKATTETRRQSRILSDAKYILRQWVAMTPGAAPAFVIAQASAAMAAAEELEKNSLTMKVPPLKADPE